ncbi:MAG TPA: IS66 family transposase [Anaerolineales bacterium]
MEALERERAENALLRQKVDRLVRRIFGRSSEKIDERQLELLLSAEDPQPGKAETSWAQEAVSSRVEKPERKLAGRGRQRWPEDLPVVEQVIEPEEVAQQPQAWRRIGQEVSEQLDYEPGRFLRRRLVRPKYVPRKDDGDGSPVIAELPPMLQERCEAAPGLLAQIIVAKYCDHLPLYRQEQIFERRHGVWLPRQNMARWMGLAADWLKPIYGEIRAGVLSGGYVQVDETPVRYLAPGHGKTKLGYLWTANRPGGDVVFHWHTSRGAECLEKIIPVDFQGVLQCDAYAAYESFAKSRAQAIELIGCLAHARRNFYEAREQAPQRAGWILKQIQHLYRVEENLRRQRAGPRLREALRASQSRPIYQRIQKALIAFKSSGRYLPLSNMGKAIAYALSNWSKLGAYLADGRLEIDNNLVENAIRPTAIGKKNWLFFGEAEAGERSAILYTIIESCRRRGLDPYAYLRDVLTRLPAMTNWQVKHVTPEAWAHAHSPRRHPAAA